MPSTSCPLPPAAEPTRNAREAPEAPAPSTTCTLPQSTHPVIPDSKPGLDSRLAAAERSGARAAGSEREISIALATPPAPVSTGSPPPQAPSASARPMAAARRTSRPTNPRMSLIDCSPLIAVACRAGVTFMMGCIGVHWFEPR